MALKIKSNTNLQIRCGRKWTPKPVVVSEKDFTEKQIERLKSDKALVVEVVDNSELDKPDKKKGFFGGDKDKK